LVGYAFYVTVSPEAKSVVVRGQAVLLNVLSNRSADYLGSRQALALADRLERDYLVGG
jgi:hypothetical protein